MKLVCLDPIMRLINAHALVALICQSVHEQAVARGCSERIDYVNLAFGILLCKHGSRVARGVHRSGNAAGERNMQNVLALFEEGREIVDILGNVYLACLGIGTFGHFLIKLFKRHALTEIVHVIFAVEHIVEADIFYIACFKVFLRKVCRRAAANYIVRHFFLPN